MTAPGPILGADLWREVIDRAGQRCECRAGCGRSHKDGQGRCTRQNTPASPLHAVARQAVPDTIAAALPASELHALCGPCHDGTASKRARAQRAAAPEPAETLF